MSGKINIIGRYDLFNNTFTYGDNKDRKISLAVASYDPIKNDFDSKYDYIIYCYGSRVEDHSKDGYNINIHKAYVDNIINYFKNKYYNIIVKFIMLDRDAPLKEDGKILANYINNLCTNDTCNSVNLLGCSKSGVMFFDMIKNIDYENSSKVNLYNIAVPYTGTIMASPKFFYKDVKDFVDRNISNKMLSSKIYESLINYYESISSNSHMDYDIALSGGVEDSKLEKYDETLIRDLLLDDNIKAIKQLNRFENFVTGINHSTLKRAMATLNFNGIGMCMLDDLLLGKKSDGFVFTETEKVITDYIDVRNRYIRGAHHDFMSDKLYCNQILDVLDNNLEEDKYFIKH